jgi:hypothetical protein
VIGKDKMQETLEKAGIKAEKHAAHFKGIAHADADHLWAAGWGGMRCSITDDLSLAATVYAKDMAGSKQSRVGSARVVVR